MVRSTLSSRSQSKTTKPLKSRWRKWEKIEIKGISNLLIARVKKAISLVQQVSTKKLM